MFYQVRTALVINLSIVQHLTNYAIFGQSRSALAIGLGLRLGSGWKDFRRGTPAIFKILHTTLLHMLLSMLF